MTPNIIFHNITIHVIEDNSGIFIGSNVMTNFSTNVHNKSGFGSVYGNHNQMSKNVHIFHDDDVIDTPIKSMTGVPK
ncbi:hypothetical protein J2S13_001275 [Oikeobacillus pervagus]|uniref:Spore germination protein n=1 Tax=Oikeobacillus pervagus TaxID=1325931 RepID=A0AAJ1WIX9_9BACI|nr:hypothetical protein [Oikeobacillus pervagus]MDQ0214878.1 hypothetical protein [Oikeobacillus pervagus]